jgi:hypothetical protein
MIGTPRVGILLLTLIAIVNFGLDPSQTLASPRANRAKPVARHSVSQAPLVGTYDKLPLSFEANKGQIDPSVKFLSRGMGYTLFLTGDEAVLQLRKVIQKARGEGQGTATNNKGKSTDNALLHIRLVGANTSARVTGVDELPGKTNYFIGNDPKKWRTNVPTYAKVRYNAVYPGVDLVYYGDQGGQVESDFVVRPGADPKAITFNVGTDLVRGAGDNKAPIRLDENGDLILQAGGGDIRFQKPVIYQHDSHCRKVNVDGR